MLVTENGKKLMKPPKTQSVITKMNSLVSNELLTEGTNGICSLIPSSREVGFGVNVSKCSMQFLFD